MNNKIDVLIIIPDLNLGGTENQLLKIFNNLSDLDIKIEILTLIQKGKLSDEFENKGIKVNCLNPFKWSKHNKYVKFLILTYLSLKYIFFIWSTKPKITHFFLPFAYWFAGTLSFFCPKTIKIMSRRSTNQYQKKYPFSKIIEKILHKNMHILIANSQYVKSELEEETNYNKKVVLIYNGVEIPQLDSYNKNLIKKNMNISKEDIVFTTIANFIPYKGHLNIIKALNNVFTINKKYKMIFIGENRNNYQSTIQKKIKDYGMEKNVIFLDNDSNINKILKISDLLISGSSEESLSNSILEAMSMQIPCLVTNVGGSPELITNNLNGFIVPPNDINAMSKNIENFSQNIHLFSNMGKNSRKKIIKSFNISSKSKELILVYKSYLNS